MIGTLNGETERLLAQGQDAARRGDKAAARSLLTQVVERDPHHELAWMWLSGVVEEPEEQQICLENVLVINPQNAKARRGLEFISTKTGIPPHYPPVPNEHNPSPTEYTAPLGADSPLFAELSGHWPPSDSPEPQGNSDTEGSEASAAILAWMQSSPASTAEENSYGAASPLLPQFDSQEGSGYQSSGWGTPANQPFNQEQLDWGQPPSQFNVMSLADGVDDRLAQFESGSGSVPPWADSGSQSADIFGGANMMPGVDPFAAMAGGAAAPFAGSSTAGAMGPMGLHSDSHLPSPSELPMFDEPAEQPWYLQSEQPAPADNARSASKAPSETGDLSRTIRNTDLTQTVECPHCKATVADTSLSCPQCKYSFFVNCPHCHELVDAADAKEGVTDPCPYCDKPINRMQLGLAGTDSTISYKSTKSSSDSMSKEAMERLEAERKVKRVISFRWVTDVVWLMVIIAAVWALSQLPTWLHLTGQY
ncbi:MAG TPA: zinc ribbon domain-containing protein [Chloroflexia bacterium]|nr:zinc ribbon domain-containing protein [Chloroflexia bacterium]